jgi:hypothetical protein
MPTMPPSESRQVDPGQAEVVHGVENIVREIGDRGVAVRSGR